MESSSQDEPCLSGLQQATEAWLQSLPPSLLEPQEGGLLVLDIQLLELAASQAHPELVEGLLVEPERVRQAVVAALSAADMLAPGQRVWLRPRQLPASAELGVPEVLDFLRCGGPAGALLACHGLCVAATAVFQKPAARCFQCACCSKVCMLYSLEAPPACCGGAVQEMEQARVMVPAQVVFLCADAPLPAAASTQLGSALLAVHLTDDLAGRVRVGDRVLVTGSGRYYGNGSGLLSSQTHLPLTLGMQMDAFNVEVLRPAVLTHHINELGAGAGRHLVALAAGSASVEAAVQVLDAALPVAASPLLKLAVLLSAAAAGTGSTDLGAGQADEEEDPEPQAALRRHTTTSRNQVNVMLTAAGAEPHIQRFLHAAAGALCDHSVVASAADPRRLLPSLEAKFVEPALGVGIPLGVGGQLAEAAPGVLLLSSSTLDTRRAIPLGQYMAAGEVALHPGCPELCVPVGATFWTMVHEQDLSKSGRCGPAAGAGSAASFACGGGSGGGGSSLSLTERVINRFSLPFVAQHDILLRAGPETEDELDCMVEALLGGAGSSGDPAALRALRYHLQAARAAAQPALSPEASALLGAYYLHLRAFEGAQQGALHSLVRVAAASARLRHSSTVSAVPDAVLAVAMVEEKLLAAGSTPGFWPRWRDELQRCTPLSECLRGLAEDVAAALDVGMDAGGCCGVDAEMGEDGAFAPEE